MFDYNYFDSRSILLDVVKELYEFTLVVLDKVSDSIVEF